MTMLVSNLVAARDAVSRGWTRGTLARHSNGVPCSIRDPHAARFDVMGAVFSTVAREHWVETLAALRDVVWPRTLPTWNDEQGHRDAVVELFDRAILRARA